MIHIRAHEELDLMTLWVPSNSGHSMLPLWGTDRALLGKEVILNNTHTSYCTFILNDFQKMMPAGELKTQI